MAPYLFAELPGTAGTEGQCRAEYACIHRVGGRRMESGTDTPEVEREIEGETSASATRSQGPAPLWLVPALALVLVAATLYVVIRQQPAAIHLIVVGAILAVLIGAIVALNPRRRSPAGGTRRR